MISQTLRNRVAGLSSGNMPHGQYYDSIAQFWGKLNEVLDQFGLSVVAREVYNNDGHMLIPLEGDGVENTRLWVSWYRMPSFRWEVITYLS